MSTGGQFDHDASVDAVRSYFDVLGAEEWDRLTSAPTGLASFEVHRRFLARYLEPGMRVLEVGAGPGRFTIELAVLGARVVVTDVSPVQLELNAQYVAAAGHESAVESRAILDVCDVSRFDDGEFDAVLVDEVGATLLGLSASNWASLGDPEALAQLAAEPDRWARFLDHEVAICAEPGTVDGGTHLLFAASR